MSAVDVLAMLGLSDARQGSRALVQWPAENPENPAEWEDYVEVPMPKLVAVAELMEAMRFYANREHYFTAPGALSAIHHDCGNRAITVLAAITGEGA